MIRSMKINEKNVEIGIDIGFLARKFKTPSYCYSQKKIKDNILNLKNQFRKIKPLI